MQNVESEHVGTTPKDNTTTCVYQLQRSITAKRTLHVKRAVADFDGNP